MNITNLQRLKMDIQGIELDDTQLSIYLAENGLQASDTYDVEDASSLKAIYSTALSVLEGLANNPTMMKAIKLDDMTVSEFSDNIMKRIDQLDNKIRQIKINNNSNTFLFYN
ncbi:MULTISPECIES: hypothetical protein [Lysinibacillus]|jgi:hypothetical protein|uniref:hypothetical protein n=1 Tax=Lysinibacillus TaxID=400634 RepID=UPI0021A46437|nr:hypothetical protein [Lysinibacillus capsici]MCT1538438.1 hypothetical protein [Lysinibacillus capsici]MCT1569146.1 hypothetical protein [Lysinibacillus capsici]MCT1646161.1 hypothetical protein [Lysinibacillus capsici]MCT1725333.1 hypothetical protein [Lysinibacillus capsici]MCT1784113.1 hypothetical protein [Lysinibacillus capsici]